MMTVTVVVNDDKNDDVDDVDDDTCSQWWLNWTAL